MSPRRPSPLFLLPLVAALLLAAGCDGQTPPPDLTPSARVSASATTSALPGELATVPLGDRPFQLYIPSSYRSSRSVPLVIGLHGYTSHSAELESYFQIRDLAESRGFLYALPDGTKNERGQRFWNAAEACCDFGASGVDDSGYLSQLIDHVKGAYAVDRVVLIGHSNGGFMSYRMACEHADQVDAIASLAGSMFTDAGRCTPSQPVSVLQIHGTADASVRYDGAGNYPGAEEIVARWRDLNGCASSATGPSRDLDSLIAGEETTVTSYEGCRAGTTVQLWRMERSSHVPRLTADFTPAVLDFLLGSAP